MKITRTEYYIQIEGEDNNGKFTIGIQKDCSQIRIDTENGDVFIDTDFSELEAIRDVANEVLELNKK